MKNLIESDFDKTYALLSELNATDNFLDTLIDSWPAKDTLIAIGAETAWQPLGIFDNNDKGIYVIKNNINNALYIGKAAGIRGFRDRQQAHFRGDENDSTYLHNVIRDIRQNSAEPDKAINDTFSWCRLITLNNIDINEIKNFEIAAIAYYKTCKPVFGGKDYNLTFGGDGGGRPKYSNEQVLNVLKLLADEKDKSMTEIAVDAGVSYDMVKLINRSNSIRAKDYNRVVSNKNLTDHQFKGLICNIYKNGNVWKTGFKSKKDAEIELANLFGLTWAQMHNALSRRSKVFIDKNGNKYTIEQE